MNRMVFLSRGTEMKIAARMSIILALAQNPIWLRRMDIVFIARVARFLSVLFYQYFIGQELTWTSWSLVD